MHRSRVEIIYPNPFKCPASHMICFYFGSSSKNAGAGATIAGELQWLRKLPTFHMLLNVSLTGCPPAVQQSSSSQCGHGQQRCEHEGLRGLVRVTRSLSHSLSDCGRDTLSTSKHTASHVAFKASAWKMLVLVSLLLLQCKHVHSEQPSSPSGCV